MKKTIRLTESDLVKLVKRVINEQGYMSTEPLDVNKLTKRMVGEPEPTLSDKERRKTFKQMDKDRKEQEKNKAPYVPTRQDIIIDNLKKSLEGKTFQLYSEPNYSDGNKSQMSNLVKILQVRMPLGMGMQIGDKQNFNLYVQDMGYKGTDPQKDMGGFRGEENWKQMTFTCSYPNRLFAYYNKNEGEFTNNYNKELLSILNKIACSS